jgi:hypothetical protein
LAFIQTLSAAQVTLGSPGHHLLANLILAFVQQVVLSTSDLIATPSAPLL